MPGKRDEEFLIWSHSRGPGLCRLTELSGFDDEHLLRRAMPLAARWPEDVRYGMDPWNKDNMVLADTLPARKPVVVASKRLADFLAARLGGGIECLALKLVNHKGRAVPDPYFIVNPLGLQDALDRERSKPTWSTISTDVIDSVRRLVVDPARVDPAVQMFRLAHYLRPVLVRRALADAIDAEGFSGTAWQALADYRSP